MDAEKTIRSLRHAIAAIENGDSSAARECVTDALNEINFIPSPYDVFDRLAETCARVDCPVCGGPEDN